MECKKCIWCSQVSANEFKVLCSCKELTEKKDWIPEPSYCKYFLNKKYTIVSKF